MFWVKENEVFLVDFLFKVNSLVEFVELIEVGKVSNFVVYQEFFFVMIVELEIVLEKFVIDNGWI